MNMARTHHHFPNEEIVLITNSNQYFLPSWIKRYKYSQDEMWNLIESKLEHPKNFRKNFWMTSLARFSVLASYQRSINDSILHIESDVVIAKDFPMEIFRKNNEHSAFPIISKERGIASVLFIPTRDHATNLETIIRNSIQENPETTDMLILRKYYDCFRNRVLPLPIGPSGAENYRKFTDSDLFPQWESGVEVFGGVFDGWDIGGYFFGTDPRNARGISWLQREVPSEFGNVGKWKVEYSSNRNFLNLLSGGKSLPIYALHLTSKRLPLYRKKIHENSFKRFLKPRTHEYQKLNIRITLLQIVFSIRTRSKVRLMKKNKQ